MNQLFQGLLASQPTQPNGLLWNMLGQQPEQAQPEQPQNPQQQSLLQNPVFAQALFKMGAVLGNAGQQGVGTIPALAQAGDTFFGTINQANQQNEASQQRQLALALEIQKAQQEAAAAQSGLFSGNSIQAQAYNILLNNERDPAKREALKQQLAVAQALKPEVRAVQLPDGTTQFITVQPNVPLLEQGQGGVLNPSAAPLPAAPGKPYVPPQEQAIWNSMEAGQPTPAPSGGLLAGVPSPKTAQKIQEGQADVSVKQQQASPILEKVPQGAFAYQAVVDAVNAGAPDKALELKAATDKQAISAKNTFSSFARDKSVADRSIDDALKILNEYPNTSSGIIGSLAQHLPTSAASRLENTIKTVKAHIKIDKLQEIRNNSPTGGAFGNVSDEENRTLESTLGSLSLEQPQQDLIRNLQRIKEISDERYTTYSQALKSDYGLDVSQPSTKAPTSSGWSIRQVN